MIRDGRRGVSTVLDVVTCLLLVTAAVGALLAAPTGQERPDGESDAAAVADVLTAATAQVEYSVAAETRGDAAPEYPTAPGVAYRRSAHATLGELLAAAALADAKLDGDRIVPHVDFRREVANATSERIDPVADRVRIRARWEPYRGAPVAGEVTVGPRPPPDADVEAATTSVSVPGECRPDAVELDARHGYGGLSRLFAGCVVETWFPPGRSRAALRGQPPAPDLVEHRYRRAAAALDVSLDGSLARNDVESANGRLHEELTDRFEADAQDRYATAERFAEATAVDRVRITVRTW